MPRIAIIVIGVVCAGLLTMPLSHGLEKLAPGISFFNRTSIAFRACLAICALVNNLATRPKRAHELEGLIWNRESLLLPPDQRHQMRGPRNPALWWAIVTLAILFFFVRFHWPVGYLPMQNDEKIVSSSDSVTLSPVISASRARAACRCTADRSRARGSSADSAAARVVSSACLSAVT